MYCVLFQIHNTCYGCLSLTNENDHHCFLNRFMCVKWLTRPILALNCRLQIEQVIVMESGGGPLVLALRSLRFLSASQILFFLEIRPFVDETSPL